MGQTIAEKILSNHSRKVVKGGDLVIADIDFAFAQDGTAPLVINAIKDMGARGIAGRRLEEIEKIQTASKDTLIRGLQSRLGKLRTALDNKTISLRDARAEIDAIRTAAQIVGNPHLIRSESHTLNTRIRRLEKQKAEADLSQTPSEGKRTDRKPSGSVTEEGLGTRIFHGLTGGLFRRRPSAPKPSPVSTAH